MQPSGVWGYAPSANVVIFSPYELNSDGFNVFFLSKSIIAKQFECSRIKHICIFHVLMVRRLWAVREFPRRV